MAVGGSHRHRWLHARVFRRMADPQLHQWEASAGDAVHNHSVHFSMLDSQASGTISTIAAAQFIYILRLAVANWPRVLLAQCRRHGLASVLALWR